MPIGSARRWAGEVALAIVAGSVFLGFLGSVELWGKREQRASAEALDTLDRGHWLVAEIQGRPRLEKPPLPRWVAAALIALTGRRDEAIVRLPNALAALATVALIYRLGRRLGGRSVGLASGFALASSAYFVVEMRQAGNDGFLALFATLALVSAWERIGGPSRAPKVLPRPSPPAPLPEGEGRRIDADVSRSRFWSSTFYLAFGLGFLTKGPVILLMVGVPIVGYLATSRRLGSGLRALWDARGFAAFVALALAWPVPVLILEPTAGRVWWLEMTQKAGGGDVPHGNARGSLALDWFWMTLPWSPLAALGAIWPLRRSARSGSGAGEPRPGFSFAWWWAIGPLAMLATWPVAKPSYYLPALPGLAVLVGWEWVRLSRLARGAGSGSATARGMVQGFWVALFVGAIVAPVVVGQVDRSRLGWAGLGGSAVALAVVAGAWAWRRGADAWPLAASATGFAAVVLIAYGALAPAENPTRGHRELARTLDSIVPEGSRTIWFFGEVDEGLWSYLRGHELAPVAEGRARFNRGFDLRDDANARRVDTPARRVDLARDRLLEWAGHVDPTSPFVLVRGKLYDLLADEVASRVEPVYRERGLDRNEMVLLRARPRPAPTASAIRPTRR